MKKIILFIWLLLPFPVLALSADSYIVMDGYSGRVLGGSNINESKLIASTTKIMTAIIALENKDITELVTVDKDVLKAYGSAIYIEVGEQIDLKDLLYGLMLRSGNDAAIEIANYVAGSMPNFVKLMNDKAKELGMTNTVFFNDNGLEEENEGNKSTAYDMALLMKYALKNETFRQIIKTDKYIAKTNYKTYEWINKNKLLKNYKYCIGGKTGFTKKARRTLVTAAKKDDDLLIVVTLNDGNDFEDHENLYEEYFEKYDLDKIVNKNNLKINQTFYDYKLYLNDDVWVLLNKDEKDQVNVDYEIVKLDRVRDGDVVGKVVVRVKGELLREDNIYVEVDEKKGNSFWSRLWDAITFWD